MSSSGGHGRLFIVSAPSGAGKTTLIERLVEQVPQLRMSRSYTSRLARPGEADGVDYNFVSRERFEQILEQKSPEVRAEISRLYAEATARDWPTYALLGVLALVLVFIGVKIFLVNIVGKFPPALSLGVTFPFNLIVGIPLYRAMAEAFGLSA